MTPFSFTPSATKIQTFSPTLDGNVYNCRIPWNIARQGYYVECYDLTGVRIFTKPLVESPAAWKIDSLNYDSGAGVSIASLDVPHNYRTGTIVLGTIEGVLPSGYAGTFLCLCLDRSTISYYLPLNPGIAQLFGRFNIFTSICAGYFNSTLIYRNNRFEVRP